MTILASPPAPVKTGLCRCRAGRRDLIQGAQPAEPGGPAMSNTDLAAGARTSLVGELEGLRDGVKAAAGPLSGADFWRKPVEPGNSVGHLVLHLTGNLNHFVGAQLGRTGYVRDREREFTDASPPAKAAALADLDAAVATFRRVVEGLGAEALLAPH